jgi:adhesin transport system outer membrane protein
MGAAIFSGRAANGVMRRRGPLFYAVSAVVALLWSAPAGAVTLREELIQLLQNHPRIKADEFAAKSAAEQVRGAFGGFLPKLDLTSDTGNETIHGPTTRNFENETSSLVRKKATATVTQKLFDGFRAYETYGAANVRREIAERTLASTRQQLILDGISAFYGVLRQSRLVEIAAANEQTIRQQSELEDERVQRGGGTSLDVLTAKSRLQLAREERIDLEMTLRERAARYMQVFGHAPDIGSLLPPVLQHTEIPRNLDEATSIAYKNNPALIASERQIEAADKNRGIAESALYPNLDLVGQANWEKNVDATVGIRRDYSVLVKLSWQLFSGFTAQANVAAATLDKSAASETYQYNRRNVSEQLEVAWQELMTAQRRVEALQNAVAISEEVFEARRRLRDAGRETAIVVLDAQREVFQARSRSVAATFDAQLAVFKVLFAMGMLGPDSLGLAEASDISRPSGAPRTAPAGAPRTP